MVDRRSQTRVARSGAARPCVGSRHTASRRWTVPPSLRARVILSVALLALGFGGDCQNGMDPMEPTAELGYTDPADDSYVAVPDGATMPLFTGGQGGSHIFATVRASGFPTASDGKATIQLAQSVTLSGSGEVLHDFTQTVTFEPIGNGVFEIAERFVFLDAVPVDLHGRNAGIDFVLTSLEEPDMTARISQTVLLELQP